MIGRIDAGKPAIEARDGGLYLCFPLDRNGIQAARRVVQATKDIDRLTLTVDKRKKPRSLDANALLWNICTEIGAALGETKEAVYKRAVQEGNEYAPLWIKTEAVKDFCRNWESRGTGWPTEIVDTKGDMSLVFAYYGSSTYTAQAFSQLVDRLVQDAKAIGIDVISERERSLLEVAT